MKAKAGALFAILAAIFCTDLGVAGYVGVPALMRAVGEVDSDAIKMLGNTSVLAGICTTALWHRSVKNYKRLQKSCKLTESKVTRNFAAERQDR